MLRGLTCFAAIVMLVAWQPLQAYPTALGASGVHLEPAGKKRVATKRVAAKRVVKRWRRRAHYGPYGFLPGVRPPEVVEFESQLRAADRPYYALPWARFHRGRWNGGGFGPCYTYTPIGPIWNCGR
jgi:hypothetical protein